MSVGLVASAASDHVHREIFEFAASGARSDLSSSRMSLSLTQQWLRQNISFYSAKDRVYADVDALLPAQPTLRPKTDVYSEY